MVQQGKKICCAPVFLSFFLTFFFHRFTHHNDDLFRSRQQIGLVPDASRVNLLTVQALEEEKAGWEYKNLSRIGHVWESRHMGLVNSDEIEEIASENIRKQRWS